MAGLPNRIAIAPNAFKGTLSAAQAAERIERGLRQALPRAEFITIPMADGGDGTMEAVVHATGGRLVRARVHDPLGREMWAKWGLAGDGERAVIELAQASGLALLSAEERNPLKATTRGTGELILAALRRGAKRILVAIGGSATNDGGVGLARALGMRFLDAKGRELPEGGGNLIHLARIDASRIEPLVAKARIDVACDVDNPLFGRRGAAYVYGPQKGATLVMVRRLDLGLRRLAKVARRDLGVDVAEMPGAGAAGGTGGGLVAFLGARLLLGAKLVMEAIDLRKRLEGCDLVITGEGRLDTQSLHGKAPVAVARLARRMRIPVFAICGSVSEEMETTRVFDGVFAACSGPRAERELKKQAGSFLERRAREVGELLARGDRCF